MSEGYKGRQHPKSMMEVVWVIGKLQGFKRWSCPPKSSQLASSFPFCDRNQGSCRGSVWGGPVPGDRGARRAGTSAWSACLHECHVPSPRGQRPALQGDAHGPLWHITLPCVLITLRLISLRHTRSVLENRLRWFGKRFLDLPSR